MMAVIFLLFAAACVGHTLIADPQAPANFCCIFATTVSNNIYDVHEKTGKSFILNVTRSLSPLGVDRFYTLASLLTNFIRFCPIIYFYN